MPQKKKNNNVDVLIVGAGPTGLTLALDLARRGVKFQIIESNPAMMAKKRTFVLHPKTMEIFFELEVAKAIGEQGRRLHIIQGVVEKVKRFELNFKESEHNAYTYAVGLVQDKLETLLVEKLASTGNSINWDSRLKNLKQTEDHVIATIERDGETEQITAAYVVGCDGVNSTVRQMIQVPFIKTTDTDNVVCADVELEWSAPKVDGFCFIQKQSMSLILPHAGDKIWRVYIPTFEYVNDDLTTANLEELINQSCPAELKVTQIHWSRSVQVQRGQVEKMRVDRVFLAGDAAHAHSLIGDQGLNMGVQDAFNLGWKLAMNLHGQTRQDVLDSYHSERHEVAGMYLKTTTHALNIIFTKSSLLREIRNLVYLAFVNSSILKNQLRALFGDLHIIYRNSPLVDQESQATKRLAQQLKDGIMKSVSVGEYAPSLILLNPTTYKRALLHELVKGSMHSLLVFLGDDPEKLEESYNTYQSVRKSLGAFVNGAFIIGEHAIDYNSFDPQKADIYLDPDGRGHRAYRCWEPTAILVRPDGYVEYRGNLDGVQILEHINRHYCKPAMDTAVSGELKKSG